MAEYEKTKRQAIKEARVAIAELYDIDLNKTNLFEAIKDLGVNVVERSVKEIRDFCADLNEKIVAAKDYSSVGVVMTNAVSNYNWENPILDYRLDEE